VEKYLIIPLFFLLIILNGCADILNENEDTLGGSLPYIDCEWLFCSNTLIDTLNSNSWLLPFWIIGTTYRLSTLYRLNNASNTPEL
tara:strand:+ start:401 stop:658 length:258 start_codon:yes stop_codon:yes gene_type:complete